MRELTLVEFDVVFGGYIGSDGEDNSGPTSIVDYETERAIQEQKLSDHRKQGLAEMAIMMADGVCGSYPNAKVTVKESAPTGSSASLEAWKIKGSYTAGGGGSVEVAIDCGGSGGAKGEP